MEDVKTFIGIIAAIQALIIGGLVPVVVWLVRMEGRVNSNTAKIAAAAIRVDEMVKDTERSRVGIWNRLEQHGESLTLLNNFRETINQIISPDQLRNYHDQHGRFEERTQAELEFLRRDADCLKHDFRAHIKAMHSNHATNGNGGD